MNKGKKEKVENNNTTSKDKKNLEWFQGDASNDNDKKKYQIQLIKEELILNPNVSCRQISDYIGITKNTAGKYLRKARKLILHERDIRRDEIKKETVEDEIIRMENEISTLTVKLVEIIGSGRSDKNRIAAIRVLHNMRERLFNLKFDAGLFTRKLGEIETTDVYNLVKTINDQRRNSSEKRTGL